MKTRFSLARTRPILLVILCLLCATLLGPSTQLAPQSQTFGELRAVRGSVRVVPPGAAARPILPRERLTDGAAVDIADNALAWVRRDGGATLLVRGPASFVFGAQDVNIKKGKVFVDSPGHDVTTVTTPSGPLRLVQVRASIDVASDTEAYVLSGEVRTESGVRAGPGEHLTIPVREQPTVKPAVAWVDWTGGLATTDRGSEPAPYGVGTVGGRRPGQQGQPRAPLAIRRMDVRVSVEGDLAVTEVDQVFFNGASDTVEGLYSFRTPVGASLTRFGVDRGGVLVWGRVQEKRAAAARYSANVYEGSKEDPALLEWDAPGVYKARLYPIPAGTTRRVVVRYTEWLGRTGENGRRRLYVFPMAAEGAEDTLPSIEFFGATFDLRNSGAKEVRAGMRGAVEKNKVVIRAHDLVPRADLAVELFDDGVQDFRAYVADHVIDAELLAMKDRAEARKTAAEEPSYFAVPIRATNVPVLEGGLDLVLVVDTSAGTDNASLVIARAAVRALLSHLGDNDRAVLLAGDTTLRPVVEGWSELQAVTEAVRKDAGIGMAKLERGGATDLGAMLSQAAAMLDPGRRGALVYIGDGKPTVGELGLVDLQDRLAKLPRPVRAFALGVGDNVDMAVMDGIAEAGFAERLDDVGDAARTALRLLETAERPAWLGVNVNLGPNVERLVPRELKTLVADETMMVVGRLVDKAPKSMILTTPAGATTVSLRKQDLTDHGDLRSRWASGRLRQLLADGIGRSALVDLGVRSGIITPYTSLYVPSKSELTADELEELLRKQRISDSSRWPAPGENPNERETQHAWRAATPVFFSGCSRADGEPSRDEADRERYLEESYAADGRGKERTGSRAGGLSSALDKLESEMLGAMDKQATQNAKGDFDDSAAESARYSFQKEIAEAQSESRPRASCAPGDPLCGFGELGGARNTGYGAGNGSGRGEGIGLGSIGTIGGLGATATAARPASPPPGRSSTRGFDGAYDESGARTTTNAARLSDNRDLPPSQRYLLFVGLLPHTVFACADSANLPIGDRVSLWRERFAGTRGDPGRVATTYREAIRRCEASTPQARARLHSMMLDTIPTVRGRVELWTLLRHDQPVADALYRGILARVKNATELRELHDALGLASVDPIILDKTLILTPLVRVSKLRELREVWPDDHNLALHLLYAFEDAGDDHAARTLGRELRGRPDADAHVLTEVGELYLRTAQRSASKEQADVDEAEARRTFGEIVEFAPEEPAARRRLGDLLQAHGWYGEAARQYETLAKLAPDDPGIYLLRAAASQGLGKLQEAVNEAEKVSNAGAPGDTQGIARTARAMAAVFLAWGRTQALVEQQHDAVDLLRKQTERLLGQDDRSPGSVRAVLMWSHPEFYPTLWHNALGSMLPATDGDGTLGLSQVILPLRDGSALEVRLTKSAAEHAARLGVQAVLTVIFHEGTATEKVVKVPVVFERGGPPTLRFTLEGTEVKP